MKNQRTLKIAAIPALLSLIFIAICGMMSEVAAKTVRHTYYFEKPIIKSQKIGTHQVIFKYSQQMGVPGSPMLPVRRIALSLPIGESASIIKISYSQPRTLNKKVNLAPQQYPQPTDHHSSEIIRDEIIYSSMQPVSRPPEYVKTHFLNGYPIALACFSPVEYIPGKQKLTYYETAAVIIETRPTLAARTARQNLSSAASVLPKLLALVDNKTAMRQTFATTGVVPTYDYLIITIEDFLNQYQKLKLFYNRRGLRTRIATLEMIQGEMPGADDQEKIRNYIIREYQTNGIQYVLLAGDADKNSSGEMQIPIRGFYTGVESSRFYEDFNIPTDIYYAALDGNWNNNSDEKWGEPDEDDLLPELAVGRICADDSSEIENIIQKIMNYQDNPVREEAGKILMVGEHLWSDPLSYGADYLDQLIGSSEENGYVTSGMPLDLDYTLMYEKLAPWNVKQLITNLNLGFNMIHHDGHSNSQMVMKLNLSRVRESEFANLDGITHLNPVIYSHGCLAGAIDKITDEARDCIAEEMLSLANFAVAFVGNSRYGWFNEGQTEGPSLHLHREYINALYNPDFENSLTRIGAAHTMSRIMSAPFVTAPDQWEPGALRWCFYACNVLGDPALDLWTHFPNQFENIIFPDSILTGTENIIIETDESGAQVTLSAGDEINFSARCDASGRAFLQLDSVSSEIPWKLVITKHNFIPFQAAIHHKTTVPETAVPQLAASPVPGKFTLSSAFPNPFRGTTTFRYQLRQGGFIRIAVYNIRGQLVEVLKQGYSAPGVFHLHWSPARGRHSILPNGIYYIQLQAPDGVINHRCVLVH